METSSPFLDWFDRASAFFSSGGVQFVATLLVVYIALLWIALIIWVTRDIMQRSSNAFVQIAAILLNIFLPILGLILYLIVRPQRTLLQIYQEELHYQVLEKGETLCVSCGSSVKEEYPYCPDCGEELSRGCLSCKKKFPRIWDICPYCGTHQDLPEEIPVEAETPEKPSSKK